MDDPKAAYLKDEYLKLQDMYEDYDRRSLQIKSWIAAASIAGIALGFDATKNAKGILWLVIVIIAACVWYLEARWKMFQHALRDRIRVLEAHFRNEPDILIKNPEPFQIYHSWSQSYWDDMPIYPYETEGRPRPFRLRNLLWMSRPRPLYLRLLFSLFLDFVFLPYLPIIAICLVIYFWPNPHLLK